MSIIWTPKPWNSVYIPHSKSADGQGHAAARFSGNWGSHIHQLLSLQRGRVHLEDWRKLPSKSASAAQVPWGQPQTIQWQVDRPTWGLLRWAVSNHIKGGWKLPAVNQLWNPASQVGLPLLQRYTSWGLSIYYEPSTERTLQHQQGDQLMDQVIVRNSWSVPFLLYIYIYTFI